MDDWERHFAEKSGRRFEKERLRRQRRRTERLIIGAAIGAILVASIIALAVLR